MDIIIYIILSISSISIVYTNRKASCDCSVSQTKEDNRHLSSLLCVCVREGVRVALVLLLRRTQKRLHTSQRQLGDFLLYIDQKRLWLKNVYAIELKAAE